MPISRRALVHSAALATAAALAPRVARAAYPERPIRLIVPFAPGGAVDAVGRLLGNAMTADLGQPVVIENRGGAGGVIGMETAAHAAPDGYTMMVSHSGFAAMPGLYKKLPFDPVRDFEGIVTAVSGIYVLVVNPSVPFKSVAELISYAKANPGKLSASVVGSTVHLAGEFFKHAASIDIVHVPYKGRTCHPDLPRPCDDAGPAVNTLPLAQAGNLRALAVTRQAPRSPSICRRSPKAPADLMWWAGGLALPAGTPKAAVASSTARPTACSAGRSDRAVSPAGLRARAERREATLHHPRSPGGTRLCGRYCRCDDCPACAHLRRGVTMSNDPEPLQ